jgi:predicted TIM-barrel fold metal-dependent hydrolase
MVCLKKTALSLLMICVSSLASSQETDDPKTMPIADVHMHVFETMSAEDHLVRMKKNNVRWGGAVGDLQPLFMKELKGRYIAPYGQKEWTRVFAREGGNGALVQMGNFDIFFQEADELFRKRSIKGFGEIHTNSLGKNPRTVDFDGPVLQAMYKMAEKYQGFVNVHHSASRAPIKPVIQMAKKYPGATFIFSHCSFDKFAKKMAIIFSKTENTFCEISSLGIIHEQRFAYSENGLSPAYKELILKFPDRVMLGTDGCCHEPSRYSEMIKEMRDHVLPHLPPEVRRKVAYGNAVRVFKLTP